MSHPSKIVTFKSGRWDEVFGKMVENGLFPGVVNRMLIYGYSRTGKSTHTHNLLKSERITFHSGMPLDDLIGGWTLRDGKTVWADGPAVRALRNGTCLQIDEINEIPMECKTVLYALMDSPAGITLPSGERVEAAPGYCVVGTMNPAPNVLPEPVYERFDIVLRADELSAGAESALGQFADGARQFPRSLHDLIFRHDFIDQSNPQCFFGIDFSTSDDELHRPRVTQNQRETHA